MAEARPAAWPPSLGKAAPVSLTALPALVLQGEGQPGLQPAGSPAAGRGTAAGAGEAAGGPGGAEAPAGPAGGGAGGHRAGQHAGSQGAGAQVSGSSWSPARATETDRGAPNGVPGGWGRWGQTHAPCCLEESPRHPSEVRPSDQPHFRQQAQT